MLCVDGPMCIFSNFRLSIGGWGAGGGAPGQTAYHRLVPPAALHNSCMHQRSTISDRLWVLPLDHRKFEVGRLGPDSREQNNCKQQKVLLVSFFVIVVSFALDFSCLCIVYMCHICHAS